MLELALLHFHSSHEKDMFRLICWNQEEDGRHVEWSQFKDESRQMADTVPN